MKKLLLLFICIFTSLIFAGCAKAYDIRPVYNESTKTVAIDNYTINDVSFFYTKDTVFPNSSGNLMFTKYNISTLNKKCEFLTIFDYTTSNNWHYTNSSVEDILMSNKGDCDIEKLGDNLNFITCNNTYYLATATNKDLGYGEKISIKVSKSCFDDMKKHFKATAKPHAISTTQKTSKPMVSNVQKYYKGKFVSTKVSKCASNGNISITITNETIGGNISYSLNSNNFLSRIKGTVIGNKFAGKTENFQFVGTVKNNSLEGTYYNDQCEGIFNAKLEN